MIEQVTCAIPERFSKTCIRIGLPEKEAHRVWAVLREKYSEPHRHYHNLSHIDKMLAKLDASDQGTDAVELAIWFHDVVYVPMGSENEVKSACTFEEYISPFAGKSFAEDVSRLIIATDPTRERTGEADEDLIIDIDLSILGASRNDYQQYCIAIRKEYSEVPEDEFNIGRSSILQQFLSQPVFATEFFNQLEAPARNNIQWELRELSR